MLCFVALLSVRVDSRSIQERLGVLAAPREVRSTFFFARLRSAVPQLHLCPTETELLRQLSSAEAIQHLELLRTLHPAAASQHLELLRTLHPAAASWHLKLLRTLPPTAASPAPF
jgi:hypothetical protein